MKENKNPQEIVMSVERYNELLSLVTTKTPSEVRLLSKVQRHVRRFNSPQRILRAEKLAKDRQLWCTLRNPIKKLSTYPQYCPFPEEALVDLQLVYVIVDTIYVMAPEHVAGYSIYACGGSFEMGKLTYKVTLVPTGDNQRRGPGANTYLVHKDHPAIKNGKVATAFTGLVRDLEVMRKV